MMSEKLKQNIIEKYPEIENLIKKIPSDIHALILPDSDENFEEYECVIKAQRIVEKERDYVMEIQRSYKLALRPNDSLKETMIRVRLKLIKDKNRPSRNTGGRNGYGFLPIDPME